MLNSQKGISLMELIIVIAIVGLILSSISSFFIMNLRSSKTSEEQLEVQYQLQNALNLFTNRLQNAENIIYNEDINSKTITVEYDKNWDGSIDSTDVLILDKTSHTLLINGVQKGEFISNIELTPLDDNGTTELDISSMNSSKIIKIAIYALKGGTHSDTSTIIYIRNKQ